MAKADDAERPARNLRAQEPPVIGLRPAGACRVAGAPAVFRQWSIAQITYSAIGGLMAVHVGETDLGPYRRAAAKPALRRTFRQCPTARVVTFLHEHLRDGVMSLAGSRRRGVMHVVLEEHEQIVAAIAAADVGAAREAARRHLANGIKRLKLDP